MHRIDSEGNVSGMFADVDPSTSTEGTVVSSAWMNAVQEEIVGVITASGATLSKPDNTQLLTALNARYGRLGSANTWTGVQTLDAGQAALALKPSSTDHVYAAWYARTATPNTRSAYIGFSVAASTTFAITNEIAGGNVTLTPGVGGNVTVNGLLNAASGGTLGGTITAGTWIGSSGGTSFTYASGWANSVAPSDSSVQVRVLPWGQLEFRGSAQVTFGSGATLQILTLPVGYRTSVQRYALVSVNNDTFSRITILPTGEVTWNNASGTPASGFYVLHFDGVIVSM